MSAFQGLVSGADSAILYRPYDFPAPTYIFYIDMRHRIYVFITIICEYGRMKFFIFIKHIFISYCANNTLSTNLQSSMLQFA